MKEARTPRDAAAAAPKAAFEARPKSPDRAAFHAFVERYHRFLLTTHLNPDGDAIGSEVAMAKWLMELGKGVCVLNDSVVPPQFMFLEHAPAIESFEPELAEERFGEADAVIVLDTSNRQRIGRLSPLLDRHVIPVAVVDHHVSHANGFGKVNVIEPEASAAGEIVYDLIREAGGTITRGIAEALYVALVTDTGSFRYSNTDSHAHHMAAELLRFGLDPQMLYGRVHSHATAGRMRFFGEVLGRLEMLDQGRLVVMEARPENFQRHGLQGSDTEGLVDFPRSIAGAEVVVLFSEVDADKVKVSLRSNGRVAIDKIASGLGGGGHPHAAGVLLRGTIAAARGRVLPEVSRVLAALPASDGSEGP